MNRNFVSYTQQLKDGFIENGLTRLKGLSQSDLSSVVYWLETKQMELMVVLRNEDDPLQAAKYRGGIEHLENAASEVLSVLQDRIEQQEKEEESE